MNTFTLTHRAKADLKSIAKFTEKRWGRELRNIYIRHFDDTFYVLSNTPEIGTLSLSFTRPPKSILVMANHDFEVWEKKAVHGAQSSVTGQMNAAGLTAKMEQLS